MFSDATYKAIGGLCLEAGVYWRYPLTKKVQLRTARSKRPEIDQYLRVDGDGDDGVRDDSDEGGQTGQKGGDGVDAGG